MPPESSERGAARLAHAMDSVRPVHDAMGIGPDARIAGALLAFYDGRPAWAVPGSIAPADALFLGEMVRATSARTILEVGVAAGCSTAVLAWAAWRNDRAGARVVAIDGADRWYLDATRPVGRAIADMLADDARGCIEVHTGRMSIDGAGIVGDGAVDLAFIDADHRHPWPALDVLAVLDLVREGGWILLHDTRLAELAARHERKTNQPAPWSQRGPAVAHRAWPLRTIHAATETANVGALECRGDRASARRALLAAIESDPWEADPTDPGLRYALEHAGVRTRGPSVQRAAVHRTPNRDRLRIALVSREFPPAFGGGIGAAMANMGAALVGAGHEVHVVCAGNQPGATSQTIDDQLTVHRVPVPGAEVDWWQSRADFAARAAGIVDALAREAEIDAVEFPECEAPALVHAVAQNSPGQVIPTVVQLHTPTEVLFGLGSAGYDYACPGLWNAVSAERACVELADAVYAPSAFIGEWAARWWNLREMPAVVPYPHAPGALDAPIAPIGAMRMVLHIGRLEPRKGVMVLAHAWNSVVERVPGAALVLAGADTSHAATGGSVRRAMMRMMTEAAADRVIFAGPVSPQDLGAMIDRAAVCVVPSLWENFPNAAIEAMARGRAILVSDRGGMSEMIGDCAGGLTFRTGDEDDLAFMLAGMLFETRERTAQRGLAARAAIGAVCDPIATTEARVALYREAIARARSRDGAARREWIDLAARIVEATPGSGDVIPERPIPGFSAELLKWVRPARAMALSAA